MTFSDCGKCYKGNNLADVLGQDADGEGNAVKGLLWATSDRIPKDVFALHPARWQEISGQRSRKKVPRKGNDDCKGWNGRYLGKFEEEEALWQYIREAVFHEGGSISKALALSK